MMTLPQLLLWFGFFGLPVPSAAGAIGTNWLAGIHNDVSTFVNAFIIGRLTMGENIGDLGGVLLGLDAYKRSLNGQPAPVIDGFTGEQRVFLGWAQVWRTLQRDDQLRQLLATNPHSPGTVRAFAPLRNVDAWYAAFDVKEGEANFIKPEDRVRIW